MCARTGPAAAPAPAQRRCSCLPAPPPLPACLLLPPAGAPAEDVQWLECDRCNKWRKVSQVVMSMHTDGEFWECDMQFDRAQRGCHLPADG
jgi:hypothetical protein